MKNRYKFYLALIFLVLTSLFLLQTSQAALFGGLNEAAKNIPTTLKKATPESIIGTVIDIVLGFAGIVFLVLTVYGGILWMQARGDEQDIAQAKKLIEQAMIGLIIVFAAYAISYFIINQFAPRAPGACPEGQSSCACENGFDLGCRNPEECEDLQSGGRCD